FIIDHGITGSIVLYLFRPVFSVGVTGYFIFQQIKCFGLGEACSYQNKINAKQAYFFHNAGFLTGQSFVILILLIQYLSFSALLPLQSNDMALKGSASGIAFSYSAIFILSTHTCSSSSFFLI